MIWKLGYGSEYGREFLAAPTNFVNGRCYMRKNIILTDRAEQIVDYVLDYTEWYIVLLIVGAQNGPESELERKKRFINHPRIGRVITQQELLDMDDFSYIDYSIIEELKTFQSTANYQSNRIMQDFYFKQYVFYNSMSYFEDIFRNNNIDFCIITNLLHGFSCDYLLAAFSKLHGVSCFVLFIQQYGLYSIYDYNNATLLSLKTNDSSFCLSDDDISDNDIIEATKYYYAEHRNSSNVENEGFNCINLLMIVSNLVRGRYTFYTGYHKCTIVDLIIHFVKYMRMINYAKKYYSSPNLNQPYIVYFLHFEPEAMMSNYSDIMESQLVAIGMLANSLPNGWTLYVKEHPDMYRLNRLEGWGMFIPTAETFFSKFFFDKISSFKNTKLISYKYNAPDLIKHSSAIASMCGTVLHEGVLLKKPVLVFANKNRTILGKVNGIYCIDSMDSLRNAMHDIENCVDKDYSDYIDNIKEYLFRLNQKGLARVFDMLNRYEYVIEKTK